MLRNVIRSYFKSRIDDNSAVTSERMGGGGYGAGSPPIRLGFESQVNE